MSSAATCSACTATSTDVTGPWCRRPSASADARSHPAAARARRPRAHRPVRAAGAADLVADFTSRYPFMVITRLLGLPRHSEEEVKRWALGMLDIQQNYDYAVQCSARVHGVRRPDPCSSGATSPGDDLISTLATTEVDGERLTDEEIFNFLRLLFPAGADTTYLGLGSTLLGLLAQPRSAGHGDWPTPTSNAAGRPRRASAGTRRRRGSPAATPETWSGTASPSPRRPACCSPSWRPTATPPSSPTRIASTCAADRHRSR